MCRLADYHCTDCGTLIHEAGLCDSCQKERDIQAVADSIDSLFIDDHAIDDDEFDKACEHADEMRHMGMGR